MDSHANAVLTYLRRLTGDPKAELRSGQLEAVETVVNGGRALVVQRTGWGKSAVYLIATALLRERGSGPTVIVSPLLALMRNQLAMTRAVGLNAVTVDSTNRDEWEEIFAQIARGSIDLLLISPERLNNDQFRREVLPDLLSSIGLLVIDEVHCISDWGHDFRPDYRRLGQLVAALPPSVPILGTTATANDRVIADAQEQLGDDLIVIRGTLERDSLALYVLRMPNKAERMAWLAQNIPGLSGSGIVYCLTIADAERVAEWLRSLGVEAASYTGPLENEARLEIERRLTSGSLKVVVATSALAMGYDNPRIEFVIHYQTPGSPIAYYQQVGRAGRAVDRSLGIALSGWEDEEIQDYFITTAFPSEEDTISILEALVSQGGMKLGEIQGAVNLSWERIKSTLKILEVEGAVYREGSTWFRSASKWTYPSERIATVTEARRSEQEAMAEYVTTDGCLMEFLRRELDDPGAEPCGRCANCTGLKLDPTVDERLVERALDAIRRQELVIEPRVQVSADLRYPFNLREHGVESGRCLTRWGDPGLAALVERGKYLDHRFDDQLVDAVVELVRTWGPLPSPSWVTWIPSSSDLVADFAQRLADALDLKAVESLRRIASRPPQKTMANSFQQARNIIGAFEILQVMPQPVLLVDDIVDSRWTFTIAGSQLRSAGSGPVYPLALADTSTGSA